MRHNNHHHMTSCIGKFAAISMIAVCPWLAFAGLEGDTAPSAGNGGNSPSTMMPIHQSKGSSTDRDTELRRRARYRLAAQDSLTKNGKTAKTDTLRIAVAVRGPERMSMSMER